MKVISTLVISLTLLCGVILAAAPNQVYAVNQATSTSGKQSKQKQSSSSSSSNGMTSCGANKNFDADPALCSPACTTNGNCNLVKRYVNPIINKFLAPLAILAIIAGIIWGGIEYSTSGGDAQKVASAKGRIQKALLALVAFICLYAFLNWLVPGGLV